MEIERKWMVNGWPDHREAEEIWYMDQGYISVRPTVRIRREELAGSETTYVLCFKGAPQNNGMSREEIETQIDQTLYNKLSALIGKPLICKERRVYPLKNDLKLEVNLVDPGMPTEFWYAEIEYPDVETAGSWTPEEDQLSDYLSEDCTGKPGSTMGEYWCQTRGIY